MNPTQGLCELLHPHSRRLHREYSLRKHPQEFTQTPSVAILHQNVHCCVVLEQSQHSHHVRVIRTQLVHLHLPSNHARLLLFGNILLPINLKVDGLASHQVACALVAAEAHTAVRAFP
jgi:hypothetical protein